MLLVLLRHGQTAANLARRYIGRTDEPLSEAGLAQARSIKELQEIPLVFCSPLQRAFQTAKICLPQAKIELVHDLRELDFGDFEGRTADEMAQDPAYRLWVEKNCQNPCPGGEDPALFRQRVLQAFAAIIEQAAGLEQLALVTHGGVIMAIMAAYARPARDFFDWHVANCSGYQIRLDLASWTKSKTFTDYKKL